MWSIHITNQPYQKVVLIEEDKIYIKWIKEELWVNPETNEQFIRNNSWEEEIVINE
jgi:hypothetical protein